MKNLGQFNFRDFMAYFLINFLLLLIILFEQNMSPIAVCICICQRHRRYFLEINRPFEWFKRLFVSFKVWIVHLPWFINALKRLEWFILYLLKPAYLHLIHAALNVHVFVFEFSAVFIEWDMRLELDWNAFIYTLLNLHSGFNNWVLLV